MSRQMKRCKLWLFFSCWVVSDSVTPWTAARQASLSFTISQSLPKFMSIGRWCYPNISSFTALFSCLQSFPALGSFPMSLLLTSGIKSIRASAKVLPMSIQGWSPLGLTGMIYLLSKGLLRVFSSTTIWKHQFFGTQPSLWFNSHIHASLLEKNIALTLQTFVGKVMPLLFNMLFRFVLGFLSRSKHLLISWLQSPSAVILEPKKIKSVTVSIFSPSISHEVMGLDAMTF